MITELTEEQIIFLKEDSIDFVEDVNEIHEEILNQKKYSFLASSISDYAKENIQLSMIFYRVDKNIEQMFHYVKNAEDAVSRMVNLQLELKDLKSGSIGSEPNCISIEFLESLSFVAILNKNFVALGNVNNIYNSDVTTDAGLFHFSQQYTPLILLGALDQKGDFDIAYHTFKALKKSYFEEGLSLYIDMLAAIVSRDQSLFNDLHLQAEAAMQSHATDKKWGDDIMTGGHEYNTIAYDYRGTALCCLAKMRGMEVNHFSCFYPKEIIEANHI